MHLTQFDAWASSFGETQTAIELAPEGTGYRAKTQLANVETQLETAKVEVTKPFKQEQELSEKLNRLNELNALLNMDETGDSRDELSEEYKLPDDVTLEVVTGDNTAGLITISFFDEKQSFIFNEGVSEREVLDILEEDNDTFAKLSRIGKCITEATCAEIEQSDKCAFSLDYNCNDKTVSVYEINGGRAGLSDPDRKDDNCKHKVFDMRNLLARPWRFNELRVCEIFSVK